MNSLLINQTFVFKPEGRLDSNGGMALRDSAIAIAKNSPKLWVLDMDHIDFMDSSGLVAIISTFNLARQFGHHLVLCNLHPSARLIFEITQLDRVFEIYPNYEACLSSPQAEAALSPV